MAPVINGLSVTSVALTIVLLLATVPANAQQEDSKAADSPVSGAENEEDRASAEDMESTSQSDVIIVTGNKAGPAEIVLGSRIPRTPASVDGNIATSTGTRGFTPGSGMDPAGGFRRIKKSRACVSNDESLSKTAACIMADAQELYAEGRLTEAGDGYALISGSTQFTSDERLKAAQWQYRIADEAGDREARELALETMIETGAMHPMEEASARRSLISAALQRGDRVGAYKQLIELDEAGLAGQRDVANLAILSRELGVAGASAIMLRAIRMDEGSDTVVPKSWRAFALRE